MTGGIYINRVVRSEEAFRQRRRAPVSEGAIVNALNHLADVFHAPAWGRTDTREVHRLRMYLKPDLPHLIGSAASPDSSTQLNDKMSPSEALYVFISLVIQKMYSPEFQQLETDLRNGSATLLQPSHKAIVNAKQHEITEAINSALNKLSIRDLLVEADQCLDLLDMNR